MLAAVRAGWDAEATRISHLPVGFGAHHWAVGDDTARRLFVTLDALEPRHTAATLEATYAATAALAEHLDFVLAPLPTAGVHTVPLAGGALSATPWVDGTSGRGPLRDRAEAEETAALLARLHAVSPPEGLRSWEPLVTPRYAAELALSLGGSWDDAGPYGAHARQALSARLEDIGRWVARYHHLATQARERTWAPTHGEPHSANQLVTPAGTRLLVDWESLLAAPAERDLRVLVQDGYGDLCAPDWAMVEMFDLEWRLDEIASYARWFSAPHTGTASDEVAWGGLRGELERAEWEGPAGPA